jgi:hypothetical protein
MVAVQLPQTFKSTWLDLWRDRLAQSSIAVWHGVRRGHARLGCVFLTYDEASVTCRDLGKVPLMY